MSALAVLTAMLLYGVVHSVTATTEFKARVSDMMGERDLLTAIRVLAVLGLLMAFLQIDALGFLGVKDAIAYLGRRPLPRPPEPLATGGVYRLVRQPLYLFGLIALWSTPVMTASAFGFTIGVTIYAAAGSVLEERKMARTFAPDYEAYRKAVPWLIPFVKSRR